MRVYNQQGQWVGRDQYNVSGNQYQGNHYDHSRHTKYVGGDEVGRDKVVEGDIVLVNGGPEPLSGLEIFSVILLSLVGMSLFFGGAALFAYGFSGAGASEMLQGVPRTVLGFVGGTLFLMGFGSMIYLGVQYPQLVNNSNYSRRRW